MRASLFLQQTGYHMHLSELDISQYGGVGAPHLRLGEHGLGQSGRLTLSGKGLPARPQKLPRKLTLSDLITSAGLSSRVAPCIVTQ